MTSHCITITSLLFRFIFFIFVIILCPLTVADGHRIHPNIGSDSHGHGHGAPHHDHAHHCIHDDPSFRRYIYGHHKLRGVGVDAPHNTYMHNMSHLSSGKSAEAGEGPSSSTDTGRGYSVVALSRRPPSRPIGWRRAASIPAESITTAAATVDDGREDAVKESGPSSIAVPLVSEGPEELLTMAVIHTTARFGDGAPSAAPFVSFAKSREEAHRRRRREFQSADSTGADAAATPIRITFRTPNLFDGKSYCRQTTDVVPDFSENLIRCSEETILTAEKRDLLINTVLPRAAEVLSGYLSVVSSFDRLGVPDGICGPEITIPAADRMIGVSGTDFVVYIASSPIEGQTMAWAGMCATDQLGRPVVARANFSPKYLNVDTIESVVRIGVHELLHALGFAPSWINSDAFAIPNVTEDSVATRRRGGQPVILYKGPAAVAAARRQYDCPHLDGIEMEDEGGEGTASSHWERRFHRDDLMAGVAGDVMAFTEMTFGLLEDSGHYFLNRKFDPTTLWTKFSGLDNTTSFKNGPNNGRVPNLPSRFEAPKFMFEAGCGVFEEKCNTKKGGAGDFFCFEKNSSVSLCTRDFGAIGYCGTKRYTALLPLWAQYFAEDGRLGGSQMLLNYCPFVSGYGNRQCTQWSNTDANNTAYGLYYGTDSRCFATSEDLIFQGEVYDPKSANAGAARCLQSRCPNGTRVEFRVGNSSLWHRCPLDGSVGTVVVRPTTTTTPPSTMTNESSTSGAAEENTTTIATEGSGDGGGGDGEVNGYAGTVTCPRAAAFCTLELYVLDELPPTTTAPTEEETTTVPSTTTTTAVETTTTTIFTTTPTTSTVEATTSTAVPTSDAPTTTTFTPLPSTATTTATPPVTTTAATSFPHHNDTVTTFPSTVTATNGTTATATTALPTTPTSHATNESTSATADTTTILTATAAPTTDTPPPISTAPQDGGEGHSITVPTPSLIPPSGGSPTLSIGSTIGIVLGVLVALTIAYALAYMAYSRRRNNGSGAAVNNSSMASAPAFVNGSSGSSKGPTAGGKRVRWQERKGGSSDNVAGPLAERLVAVEEGHGEAPPARGGEEDAEEEMSTYVPPSAAA